MCGIFALLNNSTKDQDHDQKQFTDEQLQSAFNLGKKRGPEGSNYREIYKQQIMGFHRLAINGLNEESNQPLIIDDVALICNGEIYNYKELYEACGATPITSSDCEVIIHLYLLYGLEYTLNVLDGVFAFVLFDNRNKEYPIVHVARDPYGVRPLYMMSPVTTKPNQQQYAFASELKVLAPLHSLYQKDYYIHHFKPGTYISFIIDNTGRFNVMTHTMRYTAFPCNTVSTAPDFDIYHKIWTMLNNAVKKRVVGTTERPIACLLSGGLDSSLITALVKRYYKGILETYSIGMEGSEDIKHAEQVAAYLGTKHTSIILTEDEFFNAIPEVIRAIESYDTTTVRASVGNYLIGKYIAEHSKAKVIFNGDGSDELTGGYLYFHAVPNDIEFDRECKRLLTDIHAFDVLRSDKCISSHGLEPRTPFLDREWVHYYLSIPASIRNPNQKNITTKCSEKHLLRTTFAQKDPTLLPEHILWRRKEAFSDGVSGTHKAWYEVIQDRLARGSISLRKTIDPGATPEQLYYKSIFDEAYPGCEHVVPYLWMPRFVDATDPSAKTLKVIYNK
uniref:asparagine synthase (glutamine-hydrolyzing) n=1 Tax=viral metagenome TaxID=1070528 RepID=A0A6C0HGF5_9ZZZZ